MEGGPDRNVDRAVALEPPGAHRAAVTTDPIQITAVKPLEGRWVRVWFSDGAVKDVDLSSVLARGGVFAPMCDDRSVLESVRVNTESHTIGWPGGIDLDPEVLYGRSEPASGVVIRRRTVSEPAAA